MKKFLVMVLAVMLICGGIVSVSAEEKDLHTYVVVEKNGSTAAEYKACQNGAFQYNPLWDGNAEITGLNEDIKDCVIPAEIGGRKVTSIGDNAFSFCKSITSVTVPDTVTSIGRNAFSYCSNLKEIVFPDTITSIGDFAFEWCRSLKSVNIPDSVISIGDAVFDFCENLSWSDIRISPNHPVFTLNNGVLINTKDMTLIEHLNKDSETYEIPAGIKSLARHAFDCTSLSSVIIPDSVTFIDDYCFRGMDNLKEITIPGSVTSIGSGAFRGSENLSIIRLPASVTELGSDCFARCTSLKNIEIDPENPVFEMRGSILVNKQKNSLYCYLDQGKDTFVIPEGITAIEDSAFIYNDNLKDIIIPETVTEIGTSAFMHCPGLTGIRLPDSLQIIKAMAFSQCENLRSITIPEGVQRLEHQIFFGCTSLEEVVIPASVTYIGFEIFFNCEKLICKVVESSFAQQYCEENGIKYEIQ